MDSDLKIAIWMARLLIAANLGSAILNFLAYNYKVAFACLLWTANCVLMAHNARREARVRDEIRVLAAMQFGIEREKGGSR